MEGRAPLARAPAHRTAHGSPASFWGELASEAQKTHSLPFRDGRRGLLRLAAMLPSVVAYHVAAGRKEHIARALTKALTSIIDAERGLEWEASRNREQQQRWKKTAQSQAEITALRRRARGGDTDARQMLRERIVAEYASYEWSIGGQARVDKAAAYYREHLDEWGRLPPGVFPFSRADGERRLEEERRARAIAEAAWIIRSDAVSD